MKLRCSPWEAMRLFVAFDKVVGDFERASAADQLALCRRAIAEWGDCVAELERAAEGLSDRVRAEKEPS